MENMNEEIQAYLRYLRDEYINPTMKTDLMKKHFNQFRVKYDHIHQMYVGLKSILIRSFLGITYDPTISHNLKEHQEAFKRHHPKFHKTYTKQVLSGSHAESTAIQTSPVTDIDIMYIVHKEALKQLGIIWKGTEYLMYEIDHTSPVYLKVLAMDEHNNGTCLTSSKFKHIFNSYMKHPHMLSSTYEGPALSATMKFPGENAYNMDIVFALEIPSSKTAPILEKWLGRIIGKHVFTNSQLELLKSSWHCYIVPSSKTKADGIFWRLSFSVMETAIFSHLDELQRDIYRYAKVILVRCTTVPSYYLKSTFLWMREHIPHKRWTAKTFIDLTRWLLHKLLMYLVKGCLPHYFIPEQNLLQGKTGIELKTYLQQYRSCMRVLMSHGIINMDLGFISSVYRGDQLDGLFDGQGPQPPKWWQLIQEKVTLFYSLIIEYLLLLILREKLYDTPRKFVLHFAGKLDILLNYKASLDSLYLCPHIPFSAFVDLLVAALFKAIQLGLTGEQLHCFFPHNIMVERLLISLNMSLAWTVTRTTSQVHVLVNNKVKAYESLFDRSINEVSDAGMYLTHILSFTSLRFTVICLRELLLISLRSYQSPAAANLAEAPAIHIIYKSLLNDLNAKVVEIRSHLTTIRLLGDAHTERLLLPGIMAIYQVHVKICVVYANFCVRENASCAKNMLALIRTLCEGQSTIYLHDWQVPLFDHCERLHHYIGQCREQHALGFRSVEVPVHVIYKCLSEVLGQIFVYDRTAIQKTDLPENMDLLTKLFSEEFSQTNVFQIIESDLIEALVKGVELK